MIRAGGRGLVVGAALLVGCSGGRQEEDTALVSKVGASRLAADAALLREVARPEGPVGLSESAWPTGIRELRPLSVRVVPQGVFVQRWKRFVEEEGIFVAFPGASVDTTAGRDPSFTLIAAEVYWYRIKG